MMDWDYELNSINKRIAKYTEKAGKDISQSFLRELNDLKADAEKKIQIFNATNELKSKTSTHSTNKKTTLGKKADYFNNMTTELNKISTNLDDSLKGNGKKTFDEEYQKMQATIESVSQEFSSALY